MKERLSAIGESRDPETLRGIIEGAAIGVAAYSTVHTRSVPGTLSRIFTFFFGHILLQ